MRNRPPSITEEDITEFLRQAEELKGCSFIRKPPKIKIGISWTEENGIRFSGNMPDKEAVKSLIVTIRPFIEYDERLHVGRVISYLIEKHGASKLLKYWQGVFNGRGKNGYPAITVDGKACFIREMLMLYMYGKYLHLDKEKQKTYKALEHVFGSLAEFYALSQVEKYAGIVFFVAGYIKRNKLCKESYSS